MPLTKKIVSDLREKSASERVAVVRLDPIPVFAARLGDGLFDAGPGGPGAVVEAVDAAAAAAARRPSRPGPGGAYGDLA